MQIVEAIAKVLAFRTLPTTILVVLIYGVMLSAVVVRNQVADVPKNQMGLNLAQAYEDLHHIAERPHPFISHANDIVHSYILERMRKVATGINYVDVYDDIVSNASWGAGWGGAASATYNEATNILVKIEGSDLEYASSGGVLFSAHYDSVSTASGATDDGMGVATLMQLVEYLAKNRPKRTAVFNINNGEEDGLLGAFTFLRHPWSNYTDTFLNLEGAAAGGRPVLFRGTSTPALRSFHVPHPHANVLSSDAFARGVIRSGTDYTVYTGAGMDGLDLAFYVGRSEYHTKYDAVPYTEGQEKSLWAMMESARSSGLALLNNDKTHGSGELPVYFDLFNVWFILLRLSTLYASNIVLLVVGPVVLILLIVCEAIIVHGRHQTQNGHVTHHASWAQQLWASFIAFGWLKGAWAWAKFWVAVVVTVGMQTLLIFGYVRLNPFIAYSKPYLVVTSSFTLAYLTFVFIASPSSSHLPEKEKHTMFLQTYILTWVLLLLSTIAVGSGIGGVYFITAWNASVFLACVIGCIENMLGVQGSHEVPHIFVRGVRYDAAPQRDEEHPEATTTEETAADSTERTPLLQQPQHHVRSKEESGAIGWWILQLILAVSVPVTLLAHIIVLLVGAMAQSIADGGGVVTFYVAISALVFMTVLPVVPFTFKLHSTIANIFILAFIASTAYNLLAFPFSQQDPIKVYFQQVISLGDISSPHPQITHATTTLASIEGYLDDLIVPKLPSAIGQNVSCNDVPSRTGFHTCRWESTLLPSPGGSKRAAMKAEDWLTATVARLGPNSARFTIGGVNTRACKLSFGNSRVKHYYVHGSHPEMLKGFGMPKEGVTELKLWSREWGRILTVDVDWEGDSALEGRVACGWAEYESASIGVDTTTGKIPALEEILTFLPPFAAVTKLAEGLVEVQADFSLVWTGSSI